MGSEVAGNFEASGQPERRSVRKTAKLSQKVYVAKRDATRRGRVVKTSRNQVVHARGRKRVQRQVVERRPRPVEGRYDESAAEAVFQALQRSGTDTTLEALNAALESAGAALAAGFAASAASVGSESMPSTIEQWAAMSHRSALDELFATLAASSWGDLQPAIHTSTLDALANLASSQELVRGHAFESGRAIDALIEFTAGSGKTAYYGALMDLAGTSCMRQLDALQEALSGSGIGDDWRAVGESLSDAIDQYEGSSDAPRRTAVGTKEQVD